MTDISAQQTLKRRSYNWRVVDIVVAALIAVAGGVIFWAWSQGAHLISAPVNALYPPLTGLYAGGWMIPAVLGMLIIRKPGAALFCETVAATGELMMGSQYGTTVLISGLLQGLGAELVFAAFRYKKFNLPVALLAGAGAGLFCGLNDSFLPWGWNIAYAPCRQARLHRLHRDFRRRDRRRTVLARHPRPGQDRGAEFLRLAEGRRGARLFLMPAHRS
jgi:energy-coupling factor transport system substrate-specific component